MLISRSGQGSSAPLCVRPAGGHTHGMQFSRSDATPKAFTLHGAVKVTKTSVPLCVER